MNQACFICGRDSGKPEVGTNTVGNIGVVSDETGQHALCDWCNYEKNFLDDAAIDELLNHNQKQINLQQQKAGG
jgi:hypothetical protein